ncbi:MAG: PDZ domain-containing protein, partial [Elusimicrobiota bacterium]
MIRKTSKFRIFNFLFLTFYFATKLYILFFIFVNNCCAEKYVFQIGFDLIESDVKPEKAALLSQIDNLSKRQAGGKYKYISGGKFSLSEGYESEFEIRQGEGTLLLKASYSKADKEYLQMNYDANIFFPFLESEFRFKNSVKIKPGETFITDESHLPHTITDTRPYWVVLRAYSIEPVYSERGNGGIGAVINVKDGYPYVQEVQVGSPAEAAGIKQGDVILQVDDI